MRFGQAPDVVVRLDHVRIAVLGGRRLDHVGIDRALRQPLHALDLRGLAVEDLDEGAPDDLALALGIRHALELAQELALGAHADHLDAHVLREHLHHVIALVQAQQAVVDEHAGQLLADGAREQRGDHRGIDAAREPEQHLVLAHGLADRGDRVVDDAARRPQPFTAADAAHEMLEDAPALVRVRDLGMELDAVETARLVAHRRDRRAVGGREQLEARRQRHDLVAVAHPHVQARRALLVDVVADAVEQAAGGRDAHLRVAELAPVRGLDAPAELCGHRLHAVADAEQRDAHVEQRRGHARGALAGDRFRAAGEDHAAGAERLDRGGGGAPAVDLAVDAEFAHAPRDELRVLRAEVENQDALGVDIGAHRGVLRAGNKRGACSAPREISCGRGHGPLLHLASSQPL
jgi:hypothetical protein